jgi:hypothetical protein
LIIVKGLFHPDFLIEVEGVAPRVRVAGQHDGAEVLR